jgi:endonuclease YncB( thermonuclease family)
MLISYGVLGVCAASAQGLDMDSGSNQPAPAASQSGGLDMDVNPSTPIAPKAAVQAVPGSNLQDGIVPVTVKATPDGSPPPAAAPSARPLDSPLPAVTTADRPVQSEPINLNHVRVIDTAKLQDGETTVSLYGIEGLSGASAEGLQGFLNAGGGRVTCQAQETAGFVCLMPDGTNVAQVALVNGAAKTTPDAPASYREQEAAAQGARRGVWVNLPPPPETVNHPIVNDTATLSAAGKTYALDGVVGLQAPYSSQLQGYIAGNGDSVTCSPQAEPARYICLLPDGTDVAKVALVNGAARVAADAPDAYRVQQLDALNKRRGYWISASDAVMTAALLPPEGQVQYTLAAGDEGVDGISYVGGAPVALIDGESVFLVLGAADLGWGYYDHYHHWHGAPDRFRNHMERFHPGGHGLRGYDGFRHDAGLRGREDVLRHDAGIRGREEVMRHDVGIRGREEGFRPGEVRPGMAGPGGHPGMAAGPAGHPGIGGPAAYGHPANLAMAGTHPGMAGPAAAGGFMHPGAAASAGGFHPAAAPAVHMAAAAPHAAAPSGGGAKHK